MVEIDPQVQGVTLAEIGAIGGDMHVIQRRIYDVKQDLMRFRRNDDFISVEHEAKVEERRQLKRQNRSLERHLFTAKAVLRGEVEYPSEALSTS